MYVLNTYEGKHNISCTITEESFSSLCFKIGILALVSVGVLSVGDHQYCVYYTLSKVLLGHLESL